MDYCQWCQNILQGLNHFYVTDTSTRMMGPDPEALARHLFGNDVVDSADYQTSDYRHGLLRTLQDLAHRGLAEDKRFEYFKLTQASKDHLKEPMADWEKICSIRLDDDQASVLYAVNRLGIKDFGDHMMIDGPVQNVIQTELGWDDWDRLYSVASELVERGLCETEGTETTGPHYTIEPTLWSAIWQLKKEVVANSRIAGSMNGGGDMPKLHTIFQTTTFIVDPTLCFVLMPFKVELRPLFDDIILPATQEVGLTCIRADDIYSPGQVMQQIWEHINTARVLIADLTGRNPNVFYELGLALALEKDVILLAQQSEDVPFDLQHMRYFRYSIGGSAAIDAARTKLVTSLNSVLI